MTGPPDAGAELSFERRRGFKTSVLLRMVSGAAIRAEAITAEALRRLATTTTSTSEPGSPKI